MLNVSNDACYNHAKYLEYCYINNDIQEILIEENTAIKYLTSIDIMIYDDLFNLKTVVYSYILLSLLYCKYISESILSELLNINTKFDILNLINKIKLILI